ncbi:MAG: phosphatase PAP2 family protein [Candidatus Comchoanobacterales bacterium]
MSISAPYLLASTIKHLTDNATIYSILLPFWLFVPKHQMVRSLFVLSTAMLIALALKEWFQWPLPEANLANTYAFPSGHTHMITLFLLWISFECGRTLWLYILPVAAIYGWSIVTMGYHHGIDVIGGLGLAIIHFFSFRYTITTELKNVAILAILVLLPLVYHACSTQLFASTLLTCCYLSGVTMLFINHTKNINLSQSRIILWLGVACILSLLAHFFIALSVSFIQFGYYTQQNRQSSPYPFLIAIISISLFNGWINIGSKDINVLHNILCNGIIITVLLFVKNQEQTQRRLFDSI